jgi:hypothetical protein
MGGSGRAVASLARVARRDGSTHTFSFRRARAISATCDDVTTTTTQFQGFVSDRGVQCVRGGAGDVPGD